MWLKLILFLTGAVSMHPIISEGLAVGVNYSCSCSMEYNVSKVCYTCSCYNTPLTSVVFSTSICDNVTITSNTSTWTFNTMEKATTCQNLSVPSNGTGQSRCYSLGAIGCSITSYQCCCSATQGLPIELSCTSKMFGNGPDHFKAVTNQNMEMQTSDGKNIQNNCTIITLLEQLLNSSETLDSTTLPKFLEQFRAVTVNGTNNVIGSQDNLQSVVKILSNVANRVSGLTIPINEESMKNILETAGILTSETAKNSWNSLNDKGASGSNSQAEMKNASSSLLNSLEIIISHLVDGSFNIQTPYILLNKTTFTNTYNYYFNSSVEIDIQNAGEKNKLITVLLFASMDNVLPARDEVNSPSKVINGKVTLIQPKPTITNLSITFDIINSNLENPKCVFWNFTLFGGLGGWSDEGCSLVFAGNETVSCNCNHTTSFSILMSPEPFYDPLLNSITYIGLGISMGSLVICLITEAMLWRTIENTTSYLRHVSVVNIAVSLLIANIWFFIGAGIANVKMKIPQACAVATFFIHYFYLAMFFWMLASALLLLYRTVKVFHGGLSNRSMLTIGFCLGYGGPLIIAAITIAVTAPSNQYMQDNDVCWLNWRESKALLAFVVPVLLIVMINLLILFVVVDKMLRRKVGQNASSEDERHVLVVIARSLAVLTPFFGLTWSLGVGTMIDPNSKVLHIAFAGSNSLQGFLIWVLGTLIDKKVQSKMATSLTSQVQ